VTRSRRPIDVLGPLAVAALFVGLWYWLHLDGMSERRRFLVPPPHEVLDAGIANATVRGELLSGLWVTSRIAFAGLAIAAVLGVAVATLMSQARWLERSLFPYFVALQAVPILAFVPLIALLLGFGLTSRVVVCVLIALFPIISTTLFGLLSAEPGQHDLFTLHGASRLTRLRRLQFPAALPAMIAGFRISAGLSVIGAVVGEFYYRRGEKGLGILIDEYRARLDYPEMYAAVILASLLGIAVFLAFGFLGRRLVGSWHEETRAA
jgi:NitT/TauT family transport system permease protein